MTMYEASQAYETRERLIEARRWCTGEFETTRRLSAERVVEAREAARRGRGGREAFVVLVILAALATVACSLQPWAGVVRGWAEGAWPQYLELEEAERGTWLLATHPEALLYVYALPVLFGVAVGIAGLVAYKTLVDPRARREARAAEAARLEAEGDAAATRCVEIYNAYAGDCQSRRTLPAVSWEQFSPDVIDRLIAVVDSGRASTVQECWAHVDREEAVRTAVDEQERLHRRSLAAGVASFALSAAFGVMGAATSTKRR